MGFVHREKTHGATLPSVQSLVSKQCAEDPDRMPWPSDWFEGTDTGQATVCRELWGAILLIAVRDALGIQTEMTRKLGAKFDPSDSYFHSRDFHAVCAFAGFDGVALAERLTDPDRRDAIIEALVGTPKGGASHKIRKQRQGSGK